MQFLLRTRTLFRVNPQRLHQMWYFTSTPTWTWHHSKRHFPHTTIDLAQVVHWMPYSRAKLITVNLVRLADPKKITSFYLFIYFLSVESKTTKYDLVFCGRCMAPHIRTDYCHCLAMLMRWFWFAVCAFCFLLHLFDLKTKHRTKIKRIFSIALRNRWNPWAHKNRLFTIWFFHGIRIQIAF